MVTSPKTLKTGWQVTYSICKQEPFIYTPKKPDEDSHTTAR